MKAKKQTQDQASALLTVELNAAKKETARLQRELEKAQEHQLSVEKIKQEIFGFANAQPEVPDWFSGTQSYPTRKELASIGVPVLMFSDVHWAETVDPAQVNGVNSFNAAIAKRRIGHLAKTTVLLLTRYIAHNKYPGIVIPMLGDMMSGDIHEELKETNWSTSLQALLELEEQLIAFLNFMADAFGKVYCPCVVGNHTRLTKKPKAKNAVFESLDWLLYQNLRKHFEAKGDGRVVIHASDALDMQVKIYGHVFQITHGDQFRGGGGIQGALSPWMIGDYRKRKRAASIGQDYHYLMMGHWHQLAQVKGIIVNGSVKGFDEYCMRANLDYQSPQQGLFVVHQDLGINYWMPIYLGEQKAPEAAAWCELPAAQTWKPGGEK